MANKVQTQLLVNPITRQRADALAVVMGEPRAEILRRALEGGGLAALEAEHARLLNYLSAEGMRLMPTDTDWEFAERAARGGYTLADLRQMTVYPGAEQG